MMNRKFIFQAGAFIFLIIGFAAHAKNPLRYPCAAAETPAGPVKISSPDGHLEFQCFVDKGQLTYSVTFHGKPVIQPSALGLILNDDNLGKGVTSQQAQLSENNETYPWRGKHSTATDHYKGASIPVQSGSKVKYTLEVRVFNDGVAFRYMVPGTGKRTLTSEATSFTIPSGSTIWYHGLASMHYEEKHKKEDVAKVKTGEWAGPPITVKLPDGLGYAAVTESGIIKNSGENFPGMAMVADGNRGFVARFGHEHPANYPYVLRYKQEDHERLTEAPEFNSAIESPWRVILVSSDLNGLFNSDIIYNVAPAADRRLFPNGFKEEWMKPGRSVWGYLTNEPRTLEGMKNLSRLAGELGFEYHTVEGHWARWTVEERKELVDYSNQHNVKLIFWKHSRDLRDPQKRHEFFEHLHELGVAGAKIDFFDHEAKEIIDLYAACLREAAQYKLILDFHGANKPAGEVRTWPNEMAREGVFGMEFRGPWAKHNATIPFTRMLAGHIDYTVISFGDRRSETSETHQLASALVLQSPLLIFAEHPQNLLDHEAVEFIKQIPSVWDETIVLPESEIGEVAAFARRSGDKWFVSVMNGESGKNITVNLSFLGEGDYTAMMVQDKKPEMAMVSLLRSRKTFGVQKGVNIANATVTSRESLLIELIPGGGFVGVFSK
ncbi:MAG: glycoside hydrolase family 97 N-terminal domain-containing protein [Cyclobacteriaceae bacterium]